MPAALTCGLVVTLVAGATAAELPGFPLRLSGKSTASGLLVADLDQDGRPEIVTVVASSVVVVGVNGQVRAGFPVALSDPSAPAPLILSAAPAACDLDGDGRLEIVVPGSDRRLFALNAEGRAASGFPVRLEGVGRAPASCVPASSARASGRFDLVLTTDNGALVRVGGGGGAPRAIASIGRGAESGVAVADLDGDGSPELVAGGGDSRVYAVDAKGAALAGFPYRMSFRTSGIPAVGDLNDDGQPEIVVGSQDFKIHALDRAGRALPGFPVSTTYRIYAGAALADVDRDGVLDVVVGSGDQKLYATNGKGELLAGFPVALPGRVSADVVAGDLDKDGAPEIVVTTEEGALFVVSANGKPDPISGIGQVSGAPALADLNADGLPELIVATKKGELHALSFVAKGKAEQALVAWPMLGHDPGHSGRFAPNPGRFKDLGFVNARPKTTDPLQVRYRFFDLDHESEQGTRIRWYLGGKHVPELDQKRDIASQRTSKHQRWRYTLQEGANYNTFGEEGVLSAVFVSAEIEVENTAPGRPEIKLEPMEPLTTSSLKISVIRPSADPDGDSIEYRYLWLRDGKPQPLKPGQTEIQPSATRKHQQWRVVVVPFDGEAEGESASLAVTVRNTAPGAAQIAVVPESPKIDDRVEIKTILPAPDDDHDPITYTYAYGVNGETLSLSPSSSFVPPRVLRKHDQVRVLVTAHDDEIAGGKTEATFRVVDTAPSAPKLTIWPAEPRTRDALRVGILDEARDPDGDRVELRHQWLVNGAKVDLPIEVPSARTHKGEIWRLEVTPFDGELAGPTARAETRIRNTAPAAPLVVLDHYVLATDEDVVPRIERPAADDDGDPIRLKYFWTKNGKPVPLPESQAVLAAAATGKSEQWELRVVPHDGEVDGTGSHILFSIRNSPPSMPTIAVSDTEPTIVDRVDVRIVKPASDKDGDSLVYHYRWLVDEKLRGAWPLDKAALAPGEGKKGEHWRVEVRAFDGEAEGEAATADLRLRNHVPEPSRVAIAPAAPRTDDALLCGRIENGTDVDGDVLSYRTRWYVDGKPVPLSLNLSTLPASLTQKKQSWQCDVESFDGELSSRPVRSAAAMIANTAPTQPQISIVPKLPQTNDDLVCQIDTPSADADVDPVRYRFTWRVGGKPWQPVIAATARVALEQSRVPASATERGQQWQCHATPNDGEADGPAASSQVAIDNTPPASPRVEIRPARPVAGEELHCEIVAASTDVDGDKVSYEFSWLKDGVAQPFAPSSTSVPGRLVKEQDLWNCQVTPIDGRARGGVAESGEVVIGKVR